MWNYPNVRITKIENAFIVETPGDEEYTNRVHSYLSIDNVIEELQRVFNQDGKE